MKRVYWLKTQNINNLVSRLYIDNSIQSIILIHACWLANIEITMINTRLTPNEMTNQMRSIDVQLIFVPCHWNCEGFKLYRWMILNSWKGYYNERFCWTTQWVSNMIHQNETVVPKESPSNILNTSFNLDDIASIMFTSGTTGLKSGATNVS